MDSKKQTQEGGDPRIKFKKAKKELTEAVYLARKKIIEGLVNAAHDLVFAKLAEKKEDLGGENSIFLLPGLFIITQTHILLNQAKKAEEYLRAAYWNFLKHSKLDDKEKPGKDKQKQLGESLTKQEYLQYKTNLHKTFAKLCILNKDYEQAINEIQSAIYLDCVKYGPEYPITSLNYFIMGKIFLEQGRFQQAEAFFGKIAEIWYKYLKSYFKKNEEQQEQFLVDELILEEALEVLKQIEKHFDAQYPEQEGQTVFIPMMRTLYSIGLLYRIFNQHDLCRDYLRSVYKRCEMFLPKNDKKTQKIKGVLKAMGSQDGSQEDQQGGSVEQND